MEIAVDLLVEDEEQMAAQQVDEAQQAGSSLRGRSTLQIRDTGPGFSHKQLKQMLQGEKISKKTIAGGPKYIERLELFKYAALRLAEHTLIISRSQIVPDRPIVNQVPSHSKLR